MEGAGGSAGARLGVGMAARRRRHVSAHDPAPPDRSRADVDGYLGRRVQFATGLDGMLRKLIDGDELDQLLDEAETELADPDRWGLTFTLVQAWGQRAA